MTEQTTDYAIVYALVKDARRTGIIKGFSWGILTSAFVSTILMVI